MDTRATAQWQSPDLSGLTGGLQVLPTCRDGAKFLHQRLPLLTMKLCPFETRQNQVRIGLVADEAKIIDLSAAGIANLSALFEAPDMAAQVAIIARQNLPRYSLNEVRLLTPVEHQEVWAVGVT